MSENTNRHRIGKAERDMVALGIAIAAIILFVGTGGAMMPQLWRAWFHGAPPPDLVADLAGPAAA